MPLAKLCRHLAVDPDEVVAIYVAPDKKTTTVYMKGDRVINCSSFEDATEIVERFPDLAPSSFSGVENAQPSDELPIGAGRRSPSDAE